MGCSILLQTEIPTFLKSPQGMAASFAALLVVYLLFIRPLRRKGRKDPLERPPSGGGVLAQQRAVERDMSNLLVEMSEMARQMTGQLDTRASKLELLIKEADDRIATLKRAAAGITDVPPPSERSVLLEAFPEPTPEAPPSPPPSPPPAPDPRHVEVYELADQGLAIHEIAHELGRPTGEVELILALRAGG